MGEHVTHRRIEVRHDWYGCETGCCGTAAVGIETVGGEERESRRNFDFNCSTDLNAATELGEFTRNEWGGDWASVEVVIGDLRCFDEQADDEAVEP